MKSFLVIVAVVCSLSGFLCLPHGESCKFLSEKKIGFCQKKRQELSRSQNLAREPPPQSQKKVKAKVAQRKEKEMEEKNK